MATHQSPEPQPHLWDGTPMAAMPYVISKEGDMPTHHDETLLEREHRVYEGMNMSKAERLAEALHGNAKQPWTREEVAAELLRLSAINAELIEALKTAHDHIDMEALRISHCNDAEQIGAAIAKAQGEQP